VDDSTGTANVAKDRKTAMSPQMAAAFFDLDGTLVAGDLMSQLFARAGAKTVPIGTTRTAGDETTRPGEKGRSTTVGWRRLADQVQRGVALFAGKSVRNLDLLAQQYLPRLLETCVYPGALHLLGRHRGARHPLVLVTANAYVIARVAADWLGMDHVIATQLEVKAARYTGEIAFGAWGQGKAEAMQRLARAHGYHLPGSYAYGDSSSDADMLRAVGHPAVVHPDDELRALAEMRGWPELDLRLRGRKCLGPVGLFAS
jgi:HAD superfamily hydrolase (TIGR01490 family)